MNVNHVVHCYNHSMSEFIICVILDHAVSQLDVILDFDWQEREREREKRGKKERKRGKSEKQKYIKISASMTNIVFGFFLHENVVNNQCDLVAERSGRSHSK